MKLFEVVPGNFFSVLSSGNREIYYESLMVLNDMFKYELNILADDYIPRLIYILEDRAYVPEDDDEIIENSHTPRGKAMLILRRFAKTGWVDIESGKAFKKIIALRPYAIPILKVLSEMGNNVVHEYNSLVFSTYSSLRQAMNDDKTRLYEALLSASKNTEQLQTALRTLYHGIRGFIRDIVEQNDINMLLEDHFGKFRELADKVYHPIKTLDSIYRYKTPIQALLMEVLASDDLLNPMRERAMEVKKYDDITQADEEIIGAINYVLDVYQTTLGDLVDEIDKKYSEYTKNSTEKMRYLMSADQSAKGNLTEILKAYASADSNKRDKIAAIMEKNIPATRQEYFDAHSLYHKISRNRRIIKEPLAVDPKPPQTKSSEEYLLAQINSHYTNAKINGFIETLLSGKTEIESKDIPINSDSDFILLILAVIRQRERDMTYTVKITGKDSIQQNGYYIPDLKFLKKIHK